MYIRQVNKKCLSVLFLIFIAIVFTSISINFNETPDTTKSEYIRHLLLLAEKASFCSERAAKRGYNQHVLSVSAYESKDRVELTTNLTWSYILSFVNDAKKSYPSWIVRVYYYDLKDKTKHDIEQLESIHDNLDFCDTEHLPVLGNLKNRVPGKVQRFLSAVDPLVSIAMIRDLDSEIFEREVHAVNEWLLGTIYAFHMMRDHEQHGIPILGGLWGVALNRLSIVERLKIANALLPTRNENDVLQFYKTYAGAGDQLFLKHYIWPLARYNSIAHDSYTCFWYRFFYRADTRPFPTKREHPTCFVGCPKPCCAEKVNRDTDYSLYKKCPATCRPEQHKDWIFC